MGFAKFFQLLRPPPALDPQIFSNFPQIPQKRQEILNYLNSHSTPFFLLDKQIILNRYERLAKTLASNWEKAEIAYSFKTNYSVAKSKIFQKQGSWAEVVSGFEYFLARKLGYQGNKIIFNGPVKRDDELRMAIKDRALIHLDNKSELKRILSFGHSYLSQARVGLRLNIPLPHRSSRFGFSLSKGDAYKALKMLVKYKLRISSLHVHISTDIDQIDLYVSAAEQMARFCNLVEKEQQSSVELLDMGGGFPAHGLKPFGKNLWSPSKIEDYIHAITLNLKNNLKDLDNKLLIVEPGRYLVDDAIFFVSKIFHTNRQEGAQKILTDATVTVLPLRYYRPQIVSVYSSNLELQQKDQVNTIIYGASCQENDVLFEGKLTAATEGQYLIFYCVGAYNQSMSSPFIVGDIHGFLLKW